MPMARGWIADFVLLRCGVLRMNSCARLRSDEPATYARTLFVLVADPDSDPKQ